MEQHPVPRNITGFQFHLIGDMTLRQFFYLSSGLLSAFIIYKIAPFPVIIKIPFACIAGFGGFAFAFLPIQERPLDRWLVAFIKSIFSPTQYLWIKACLAPDILSRPYLAHLEIKDTVHMENHKDSERKLRAYLSTLPVSPHETLNAAEKNYIDKTLILFGAAPTVVIPTQPLPYFKQTTSVPKPPLATSPARSTVSTPVKPQPIIQPTITTLPEAIPQPIPPQTEEKFVQPKAPPPVQPQATYEDLTKLSQEKMTLEKELQKLRQEILKAREPVVVRPITQKEEEPTIKSVTARAAISEIGLPNLPSSPNIIIGVIKDPQKKILPNIILTIKDQKGTPLRALKTNKLGQFATATPLPNGTYFLEVEDPLKRFVFDIAQLTLSGKIFLPIEIIVKGEKELMRERLTKELFSSANM